MTTNIIAVTGGYGFIGSAYIRHLIATYPNVRIINIDALTYAAHPESIPVEIRENREQYKAYCVDIRISEQIEEIFRIEQPTQVVHFAAESHVDRSIVGPREFITTNVEGTLVLLQAARSIAGFERFVMVSTDEVYGSLTKVAEPSTEWDNLYPRSPYSASKAGAEHLALSYYETYQLPVVVTRGCNNIGPWQYPEKVVPVFVIKALRGENLPVYGTGQAVRDYIYVDDHCRGIDLVRKCGALGNIYNVGGDNQTSGIALANMIIKAVGSNSRIALVDDRLGHDMRYALNSMKIQLLGWKRLHSFQDALALTVQWYKNHEEWWSEYYDAGTG